jgi:hypothetical protein
MAISAILRRLIERLGTEGFDIARGDVSLLKTHSNWVVFYD